MLKTDINYIGKMKEGIQRMKPKTKDSGDSKKDINLLYFNQDEVKTINKKKIIGVGILLVIICLILVIYLVYAANENFRAFMDANILNKSIEQDNLKSITLENYDNSNIFAYSKYIAILKDNTLTTYNSSGKIEAENNIQITNPITTSNGKYLIIAEQDSSKIYLLKDNNIRWEKTLEGNISRISVNSSGYSAIILKGTAYKSVVLLLERSSIQNAGLPWELGLAETHQTLIQNGLRERVRIETDGKLMSGRDVAIAAILGAEEFGFATAPLVTMGCVMMRVCNLDTCPVGVATQNPELRKRFSGKPEYVVNFMRFIAEELREYMAKLGVRTVDELIGRTDLLYQRKDFANKRANEVDLHRILDNPYSDASVAGYYHKNVYDFELEKTLDKSVLIKKLMPSVKSSHAKTLDIHVGNVDRAFGTQFGAEITRLHPDGLPEDTITVHAQGSGGQSFGAFIPKGLTMTLEGDSNDYFGKGLSGGKLVVFPPNKAAFKPDENIIIGNVALYGATSGKAFIEGVAGERFAVRNSGAIAVVEGVGDHGCEYMTGGRVAILGPTGKNFAAGMSGGIAYVLDEHNDLYTRLNKSLISIEELTNKYDVQELKEMITEHAKTTGSAKGKYILEHFSE